MQMFQLLLDLAQRDFALGMQAKGKIATRPHSKWSLRIDLDGRGQQTGMPVFERVNRLARRMETTGCRA
jgi:hypothetical protein